MPCTWHKSWAVPKASLSAPSLAESESFKFSINGIIDNFRLVDPSTMLLEGGPEYIRNDEAMYESRNEWWIRGSMSRH